MNVLKSNPSLVVILLAVLSLLAILGCDSDDSVNGPGESYTEFILTAERLDAQNAISQGDTLWVTFANISLIDGCRSFERIEFEEGEMYMNFTLIGKKSIGLPCPLIHTLINITIPVTDLAVGTHYLGLRNPDNTYLEHFVEVN